MLISLFVFFFPKQVQAAALAHKGAVLLEQFLPFLLEKKAPVADHSLWGASVVDHNLWEALVVDHNLWEALAAGLNL